MTAWHSTGSDNEPGGYLNASFNDQNGTYVGNTEGEYAGYTTSIIANKSIEWVKKVVRSNETSHTHAHTHAHTPALCWCG